MKAIENMYKILSSNNVDNSIHVIVEINFNHEVFRGHFPATPVLPGVCTLGIIKELVMKFYELKNFDFKIKEIKYLTLITPDKDNKLIIDISKNGDAIVGVAKYNNEIAVKIKSSIDSQIVD